MALQIVRGIFAMVSCKQCPVVVDETANFPNKKQLTLFKPSWVMTEGSYRIHNITQWEEVVIMVKTQYLISPKAQKLSWKPLWGCQYYGKLRTICRKKKAGAPFAPCNGHAGSLAWTEDEKYFYCTWYPCNCLPNPQV